MRRVLGILADDFTGALMVASYIERAGIPCPVLFNPNAPMPDGPLVVAGLRTRTIPVQDALEELGRVTDRFIEAGFERLAYKACATFDSTAEGNIGPAADYLADRLSLRPVLMSAGFPQFGTTVHQGYLFYRGRLVTESIKRHDPLTPMPDPDLVRFLSQQTPHAIRLIDHATLLKGNAEAEKVLSRHRQEGAGHVFFDMTDDTDVEVAAELASDQPCIVVGSDPFIIRYATRLAATLSPGFLAPLPHIEGAEAVLVGSTGPVAMRQVQAFAGQNPVLTLDLLAVPSLDTILEWAAHHMGQRPFAISTATDAEGVERVQQTLGALSAARRAEELLGSVAKALHQKGVKRFVVSGGETSGAVVTALGIRSVRIVPGDSAGLSFCVSDGPDPVWLCLKPGKLGSDDILLQALGMAKTSEGDDR